MSRLLEGRTALVTGGTRGLGRSICLALAREGAQVAFNYVRSDAEAEKLLAELRARTSKAWAFKASVLDRPAIQDMVRANLRTPSDARFVSACREATGGVPFLLQELLSAMAAEGVSPSPVTVGKVTSRTVAHATLLRVARLGGSALPVARAVAVLGPHAGACLVQEPVDGGD